MLPRSLALSKDHVLQPTRAPKASRLAAQSRPFADRYPSESPALVQWQAVALPFQVGADRCGGNAPLAVGHVGGKRAVQDGALRDSGVGGGLADGQVLAVRQVVYEGQHRTWGCCDAQPR